LWTIVLPSASNSGFALRHSTARAQRPTTTIDDRIMAREITARWTDRATDLDFTAAWHDVRRVVLEAFSDSHCPSVQFTPASMGDAVLQARPEIERIRFSLPNKHHLLFDLGRFGLENDNEIFQPTTEPYGLIEGTVERAPVVGSAARVGAGLGAAPTPPPPPARSSAASAR